MNIQKETISHQPIHPIGYKHPSENTKKLPAEARPKDLS